MIVGILKEGICKKQLNSLRLSMGRRPPAHLGTMNTTGIKNSATRRWFYHTLSKQLIHFLLNNGIMSCSCPHNELPDFIEQGQT